MKMLQEFVRQDDLARSDGSDAGKNDVQGKGAEVSFNLMRNTINSDGKITGSGVANYLEKAHDLNDEVDTVLYGLETDDGKVVKVYVNAQQADAFEAEMKKMLGMQDDIEEAIETLASRFDIVDVVWPEGSREDREHGHETGKEDDFNIDDNASMGAADDEEETVTPPEGDEDADMEVIATADDTDDEETPAPEKAKKGSGAGSPKKKEKSEEEETSSDEEEEASGEEEEEEDTPPPPDEEDEEELDANGKPKKKEDKHAKLKKAGAGLAGKKKEPEAEPQVEEDINPKVTNMSIGSKFLNRVLAEAKDQDADGFRDNFDIPDLSAQSPLMSGISLPMARQVIQLYHILGVSVDTLEMRTKAVKTGAMETADKLRTNRPLRLAAQRLFSQLATARGFARAEKAVAEAMDMEDQIAAGKKDPMSREKDVTLMGGRIVKQIEAILGGLGLPASVLQRAMRQDRDSLAETAQLLQGGGLRTRLKNLAVELGIDIESMDSKIEVAEATTVPTQGTNVTNQAARPQAAATAPTINQQYKTLARSLAIALGIPEQALDRPGTARAMDLHAMRDRSFMNAVLPRMQFIVDKLSRNDRT